jgi:hypothetical protein
MWQGLSEGFHCFFLKAVFGFVSVGVSVPIDVPVARKFFLLSARQHGG